MTVEGVDKRFWRHTHMQHITLSVNVKEHWTIWSSMEPQHVALFLQLLLLGKTVGVYFVGPLEICR